MKKIYFIVITLMVVAGVYGFMNMHHHNHGKGIMVVESFARATTSSAKAGGAFLTIHNAGPKSDRLIRANVSAADKTELHTHKINSDDVAVMMKIEGGIDVPVGMTSLAPGGNHVMMMGLNQQLIEGKEIQLELIFEVSKPILVNVPIKAISYMGLSEHSH